jgi:K+-sensing histidine kinase KdpD
MARLNNGDINIELSQGDLAQSFSDACNRWKTQNPAKELQTNINLSQTAYTFDNPRMRQIIGGLLTYAANHVADGGKLSLRATDIEQNVSVEIESTGEKARDKFEMDLAMISFICRGLINLHGGCLTLGDDTGSGLGLSFTLPKK